MKSNDPKSLVGQRHSLTILRLAKHGIYLGLDSGLEDLAILLPLAEMHPSLQARLESKTPPKPGDKLEVFIYTDSEDRLIATMKTPLISLDKLALLKVVDKNKHGIFLDMGLAKHLFMPTKRPDIYALQSEVLVLVSKDKQGRLIAKKDLSPAFRPCFDKSILNKSLEGIVFGISPLGFSVVTLPDCYAGLIYKDNARLRLYQTCRVKPVRLRRDGKIDFVLEPDRERLASMLKDKESPFCIEDIDHEALGISKKALKRELSSLIDSGKLAFTKGVGYSYKP